MKLHKLSLTSRITLGVLIVLGLVFIFGIWLINYSSIIVFGIPRMVGQLDPAWSPDEKFVAFECCYFYPTDGYDNISRNNPGWWESTREICYVNMETREFKRLTYGRYKLHPVWPVKGSKLMWQDYRSGLMEYDIQSGLIKKSDNYVEYYRKDNNLPKYTYLSPNKKYLIQLVGQKDGLQGFNFFINENDNEIFKGDFLISTDPAWSPDSALLALKKSNSDEQEIIFIYLPTREMASLKVDHPVYFLSWSQDGAKLAFQANENLEVVRLQFKENPFSCSIMEKTPFILNGTIDKDVVWSPSGRYITFIKEDGFPEIWLLDLQTGKQMPLITNAE